MNLRFFLIVMIPIFSSYAASRRSTILKSSPALLGLRKVHFSSSRVAKRVYSSGPQVRTDVVDSVAKQIIHSWSWLDIADRYAAAQQLAYVLSKEASRTILNNIGFDSVLREARLPCSSGHDESHENFLWNKADTGLGLLQAAFSSSQAVGRWSFFSVKNLEELTPAEAALTLRTVGEEFKWNLRPMVLAYEKELKDNLFTATLDSAEKVFDFCPLLAFGGAHVGLVDQAMDLPFCGDARKRFLADVLESTILDNISPVIESKKDRATIRLQAGFMRTLLLTSSDKTAMLFEQAGLAKIGSSQIVKRAYKLHVNPKGVIGGAISSLGALRVLMSMPGFRQAAIETPFFSGKFESAIAVLKQGESFGLFPNRLDQLMVEVGKVKDPAQKIEVAWQWITSFAPTPSQGLSL